MLLQNYQRRGRQVERLLLAELAVWARAEHRAPLLLTGAPRVGKSWLLGELGRTCFEHVVRVDVFLQPRLALLFNEPQNPQRTIRTLARKLRQQIFPRSTLLIFENIHLAPRVFAALGSFARYAPEYAVAASCSSRHYLVGIT